jgi:hypothetical protein
MHFKFTAFFALSLTLVSCCTGKDKISSEEIKTEPVKSSKVDCDTPPQPVMCCQAMTPACNECRETARIAMQNWLSSCPQK